MTKMRDCEAIIEMDSRRINAYQGTIKGCDSWLSHQWEYSAAKRKLLYRVAKKYNISELRLRESWKLFYKVDWFDPYL